MNSLIEEQMNMFWLGEEEQDTAADLQVDEQTGDFYFWLGGQGDVTATMLSREDFEEMLKNISND